MSSVAFVTNFCPHYRVRTFELLAERLDAEFLFFSEGREWYWQSRFGQRQGNFPHEYLPGVTLAGTRIVPSLPLRLSSGNYDVIIKCINGRFALPAAFFSARAAHRPFVLWTGIWHRLRSPVHRLAHPLTNQIYRRADAVVTYGEHVKRFLIDSEGVEPHRIFVAPHATEAAPYSRRVGSNERAELARGIGLPESRPVVLYAGRLEPAKGVDDVLEAFLALPEPAGSLLFVGEGTREATLRAKVSEARADSRVFFVRGATPESMPAYYELADVLVLASRTTPSFKEPWGLVVNEAFYKGVPAITTTAVGAAAGGLVEDGRTGLVVPESNVPALSEAIGRLLSDTRLRHRLGASARSRMRIWSNQRMVDGFVRAVEFARRSRCS